MNKKFFVKFCGLLAFVLAALISCEIGLGESVDTSAPEGKITSPGVNAVIRDAFMMKGSWKDDGSIKSVQVNLKSTDKTLEISKNYEGSATEDGWNVVIDPVKEGLLDGKYEATVTLTDNGGHSSSIKRSYVIDNTAPVVVLSYLKSAGDSSSEIKTYGKVFSLSGKAADANNIDKVDIKLYNQEDGECLATVTKLNLSGAIDETVATFGSDSYTKLYGSESEKGSVQCYCRVFAYDEAQRYPADGSEQTDEDKLGNCRNSYWLQTQLELLGYDKYKLSELYAMYSGTYDADGASQDSGESVTEIKENISNKASVSLGTFNLNPKNNPSFTVIGLNNVLKTGDSMYDDEKNSQKTSFTVTNGDKDTGIPLTITITPGIDNYSLKEDTVKIWFQKCDKDGNLDENAEKIMIAEKTSSCETKPVSVENYTGLETDSYYRICVEGQDTKGNEIEAKINGCYAFYLAPVNGVIELNLSTAPYGQGKSDFIPETAYISSETGDDDYKALKVTLSYSYSGDKVLKVYRKFDDEVFEKDDQPIGTAREIGNEKDYFDIINAEDLKNHTQIKYFLKNEDSSNYSRVKTIEIKRDDARPEIFNPDDGDKKITIPGAGDTSNSSFSFKGYASDVLPGSGLSKVFVKLYETKKAVNGEEVEDEERSVTKEASGSEAWSLQVIRDDKSYDKVLKKTEKDANGQDVTYDAQGEKKVEIWAVDKVGLESEHIVKNWIYKTSIPVLKTTYYKEEGGNDIPKSIDLMKGSSESLILKDDFTLKGIAEDGYGVKKIEVIQTFNGDTSTSKTLTTEENGGIEYDSAAKTWLIKNSNLNSGIYTYEFTVTDDAGLTTKGNTKLFVTVDKAAPSVESAVLGSAAVPIYENEAVSNKNAWYSSKSLKLLVNVKESLSDIDWVKYSKTGSDNDDEWFELNPVSGEKNKFRETIELSEGKDQNLFVKVRNNAGRESESLQFKINIDESEAELSGLYYMVEGGSLKNAGGTAYTNGSKKITLYGSCYDLQSGISGDLSFKIGDRDITAESIKYYIVDENDAENHPDLTKASDFEKAVFAEDYSEAKNKKIKYFKAEFTPASSDSGKLTLIASNGAGKESKKSVFTITSDAKKPEVAEISIKANSDKFTVFPHKDAEGKIDCYYLNNNAAAGTYTISGLAEDNADENNPVASGVDTVSLEIEGLNDAEGKTKVFSSTKGLYFADLDLSTISTAETSAKITVTDNAGNTSDVTKLKIVFDTKAPVGLHAYDNSDKDLYFRIGDQNRDSGLKDDGKTAVSGAPAWNKNSAGQAYGPENKEINVDEDVGGKYSSDTFGNAETIKIRGTFDDDSGSGIRQIYYKVYSVKPDSSETGSEKTKDFLDNYATLANGSFSLISELNGQTLEQQGIRRVFYSPVTGGIRNTLGKPIETSGENAGSITENGKTSNWVNITSNFKTTISGLALDQANYLVLVAVDNVGNAALDSVSVKEGSETNAYYKINVDKTVPEIKAEETSGILYSNGSKRLSLKGSVKDTNAGIREVELYASIDNKEITFPVTLKNGDTDVTLSSPRADRRDLTWSADIDTSVFKDTSGKLISGSVTLSVRARDDAGTGNITSIPAATIIMDGKAPEVKNVKIITGVSEKHENTSQVNGTVTISGEAGDDKSLAEEIIPEGKTEKTKSMALYYTTKESVAANKPVAGENGSIGDDAASKWKLFGKAEQSANWSFSVDTTVFKDKSDVWFCVAALDAAGNTGYSDSAKVYINQDTDRPVIKLTNLELGADTSAEKPKRFANNEIYGNVSDDDGIPESISCYVGTSAPEADSTKWITPAENSDFTYSNGSFTLRLAENSNTVWFKIGDFVSSSITNLDTDENKKALQKSVKLLDSKGNKYGYLPENGNSVKATALYTIIDIQPPSIKDLEWSYPATSGGAEWKSASSMPSAGGTGKKHQMNFRVYAYDATGVNSVKLEIPANANDNLADDSSTKAALSGNSYVYSLVKDESKTEEDDEGNTYFMWSTSSPIDVSGMESSTRECKLIISDSEVAAEAKTTRETFSIKVDNTPAEFEFTSHKNEDTVYGVKDIEIRGNVTSNDMAHVYYYLTKGDVENAAAAKTEIGDKWKEVKFEENKTSTVLAFDMQNNNVSKPENENHDLQLRQWLASLYNVSNIDAYNDTKSLKIWVYVTDAMDNDSEPLSLYLNVIPNGDKPVVSISYPEEGAKLGGTIRFSGESSIETSSVSKVYAQILVPGASSENWVSELDKLISEADNKSNGKEPYYKVSEIEIDSKKVKVVEVSGTPNSWNFSINGHHELEKDGETPDYTVNFIAVSETGKKSDIVSRTIQIDKNAPVITFELVKLKDAAKTGSEKFAESNIEKRISYKEDMWISGSWYLTGSAADDNGIKELIWNDVKTSSVQSHTLVKRDDQSNTGSIESANADKVVKGQEHTTKYKDPTDPAKEITIKANDYNFYIPIETSGSFGSVNYSVSAVDATSQNNGAERTVKINYDNQSPVFKVCESSDDAASELAADGNKIQNHSGMYSLYGTFDEDGNQSGFERIVMYFTRTIESKTSIIDPMAAKTLSESDEKNNNYYDISAFNPYSSVEAGGDGIYWKELTATSVDNDTISLTVSDAWVRKGGLCKVDGVIYRIKSVSASEIKIEGSLKESTSKKVFVSPALVIDNLSSEGKKGSEYSGLYNKDKLDTIAISGGDGDWMIEGVSKQGTSYPWTASINSHNLLDGPVTIHFVAFDKAGNASEKAYSGSIANNAPRLAGLTVWTDYNGNGKGWRNSGDHAADYENETKSRYYSRVRPVIDGKALDRSNDVTSKLIVSANPNDAEGIAAAASSAFMKVTDTVKFIPEIVGGNGALFYEYKIGKKSAFTLDEKNNISKFNASETAGSKALKSASLAAITDDEGSAVLGSDDGQNIPQTTDDYSVTYVNGKTDGVITFTAADILSKLDTSTSTDPSWFDLVISDSTEGDSKLSCEMQVALQVNYIDGTAPWAKIKPFYWASRSSNSLAWNEDTPLGHIELEDDLTSDISRTKVNKIAMGDDPKVSGKIKLEGSAFDDIRLKKLYARFTDHKGLSSYKLIAEYDKAEGEWTGKQGDGWEASVENLSLNSEGHRVKWTVILDTAQVADSAKLVALDRAFTLYAVDAANERDTSKTDGNSSKSAIGSTQTAKASENAAEDSNWTAYYKMDVVPYITEVVTHLSPASESNPSVFARTALGKYPVYEGETIQFTGFNIGTNTAKVTVQGMTETQLKAGSVNNESADNTITLTRGTGSGAKSGDITLTVEGIPALNNMNNDDAKGSYSGAISDSSFANCYNRQPNGINNNNLNDNVSLDVWQFLNAAEPRNGKSDNPTMKISSKGRIGISYSNAVVYFSAPFIDNSDGQSLDNIKSQTAIAQNYGWFTNNTFCFDQYGYPYAAAQSPDTDNSKGAAFLQFFSRKAGKNITDMGLNENYQKIANSSRIEAICIPINANEDNWTTDIDRTQSICMATSMPNPDAAPGNNNKVTIHMAYWDNLTKQIRYRQGQVGANPEDFGFVGNGNNYRNYGGSLLDLQGRQSSMQEQGGRFEGTYDSISSKNTNGNNAVKDQRIYRVAGKSLGSTYAAAYQITTEKHGGKYVDIGVLPSTSKTNPTVVLCWYDADAKRLVVSYDTPKDADAKDDTGMCNGNWQTNASYIGNKGGMYCRMAIDADDGIHIAHYDYLGANLLYTYIPSTGSVPQLSSARTFVVDSYLSVGTWCTIDVAKESNGAAGYNYVPQIGYFTPACEDSTAAARIAKAAKFDENGLPLFNGAENDKYTGAWEISVVPTEHIPIIDRVNVGMYKNADGVLQAIPTGGTNRITVSPVNKPGYPVSDSTTVYGNGTTNPAVLYCLDDGPVELAQKK